MADENTNPTVTPDTNPDTTVDQTGDSAAESGNDELAKLRAELAKQKAATDKAAKEAGEYRKQLRAKQSAEEIAAEEKRIQDEEKDRKLAELEKRFAVAEISKKVMTLGSDEAGSAKIAELMYGAEDADAALTEIGKLFAAREKALRLEFGKIPAPGVGNTENAMTKDDIFNIKDPIARQKAIANNLQLFR